MALNDVIAHCMDCGAEITNADRLDVKFAFSDGSTCPFCGGLLKYKEASE